MDFVATSAVRPAGKVARVCIVPEIVAFAGRHTAVDARSIPGPARPSTGMLMRGGASAQFRHRWRLCRLVTNVTPDADRWSCKVGESSRTLDTVARSDLLRSGRDTAGRRLGNDCDETPGCSYVSSRRSPCRALSGVPIWSRSSRASSRAEVAVRRHAISPARTCACPLAAKEPFRAEGACPSAGQRSPPRPPYAGHAGDAPANSCSCRASATLVHGAARLHVVGRPAGCFWNDGVRRRRDSQKL